MKFNDLIIELKKQDLLLSYDNELINIEYISYNSNDVIENTLFICKGVNFKKEYLEDAINKGVVCYISEVDYSFDIPKIIVKDVRKSLAIVSSLFYKDNLFKIGITGTKGKTTTNYFIHNILKHHLGYEPGIFATHYFYSGLNRGENHLTTPESLELHKYLNEMTRKDLKYVSMEVSSQAVKHNRVFGMNFDVGVFLNISEDHISDLEHKDFEDYFISKLGFLSLCNKVIIFKGTDHFERIKEHVSSKEIITFGFEDSDYIIKNIYNNGNICFELFDGVSTEIYEISMLGRFNVINAVAAIIIAKIIGVSYKNICKGLIETFVSGRMDVINDGVCPIIIDYAHNGLSAEAFYKSIRVEYPNKKIKVLFGCPGDKGVNRREEMGIAAGKYADYVYLTAEDPGSLNVNQICDEIIYHISKYHNNYEVIEDREEAIKKALCDATSDDIIALLGKGDETYQIVGNEFIPYETDKVIVLRELSKVKES